MQINNFKKIPFQNFWLELVALKNKNKTLPNEPKMPSSNWRASIMLTKMFCYFIGISSFLSLRMQEVGTIKYFYILSASEVTSLVCLLFVIGNVLGLVGLAHRKKDGARWFFYAWFYVTSLEIAVFVMALLIADQWIQRIITALLVVFNFNEMYNIWLLMPKSPKPKPLLFNPETETTTTENIVNINSLTRCV
jgi:hypothetical protein